jgi:hypothetical protein
MLYLPGLNTDLRGAPLCAMPAQRIDPHTHHEQCGDESNECSTKEHPRHEAIMFHVHLLHLLA